MFHISLFLLVTTLLLHLYNSGSYCMLTKAFPELLSEAYCLLREFDQASAGSVGGIFQNQMHYLS